MAAVDDARDLSGAAHPPEVLPVVNFYGVALKITGRSPVIARRRRRTVCSGWNVRVAKGYLCVG